MSEPMIKKSTYDIEIGERTVSLRLTVSSQLRLKNKFKQESIDTILEAASDPEKLLAVFHEALNFKDNENDGLSGEELYDLLVDNGTKGIDAFAKIVFGIANASGILSDKQTKQVENGIDRSYSAIFEHIEKGAADTAVIADSTEDSKNATFPEQ